MGYAVYGLDDGTFGGYGVPCFCTHPKCNKEIHRGQSYLCGGEPRPERGCGLRFCGDHKEFKKINGEYIELCSRCARKADPYAKKPEHPTWLKHVTNDKSWQKRRSKTENMKLLEKRKQESFIYKKKDNDRTATKNTKTSG